MFYVIKIEYVLGLSDDNYGELITINNGITDIELSGPEVSLRMTQIYLL